jgi:outer membrane protein assembly factor BamB
VRIWLAAVVAVAMFVGTGTAVADDIGNAGSDARTGWYSDEQQLSPSVVGGNTFGQLWSANVDGQVYAQPLLSNDGTLVVTTENDKVYGLDSSTGSQLWEKDLGTPWNPGDIGCADIQPSIGTTATPVIDTSTNPATVYLTHKTYASGSSGPAAWYMDALNVATGHEQPNFPVLLSGNADNAAGVSFSPTTQQQRPGLLLMNGVVYAGFGSHCDNTPFRGWVFGVSTSGQVKARWTDNVSGSDGAGIWQSGTGLSSDASGSILLATGNGDSPTTPTPGNKPPSNLGNSAIRLQVQSTGKLKAVDFFTPYDAATLDEFDSDFGSAAVVVLPDSFGTTSVPHTAIAVGKEGNVYLLNRDNLGGFKQGTGQGDAALQRLGPFGAAFGRAGVWPGDGGYVYLTTDSGQPSGGLLDVYKSGQTADGKPSLAHVATASDASGAPNGTFGFGSGPAVVTSDGTISGSALVWVIWSSNRQGNGGQLRVYNPVPSGGTLNMIKEWSIGNATNYSTPGVGGGRLYVGTRDGKVLAFGSPISQPLSGSGLQFPTTTIGQTSQKTLTLTANRTITVNAIASTSSRFTVGTPTPGLPATLHAGDTISVPVSFTPTDIGLVGGEIDVSTSAGSESFSVSGTGQQAPPKLTASEPVLSFPGTVVAGHSTQSVQFTNAGAQMLRISGVTLPSAPFSSSDAPQVDDTIAPGASITVDVDFNPTTTGTFMDKLIVDSDGGTVSVGLSATASTPGNLVIAPAANDYGSVVAGDTVTKSFTVTNTGGTTVTISKSKPPFGGEFSNATLLDEGSTIQPGETVTEEVRFAPTQGGAATGTWVINGNDTSGLHTVQFSGTGLPLSGSGLSFGPTTVGQPRRQTLTLTAREALTVQSVASTSGRFTVGGSSPGLPATLAKGASVAIPVTFSPTAAGTTTGLLSVSTTAGAQALPVSGTGQLPPQLSVDERSISFAGVARGRHATHTLKYTNLGGETLTISAIHAPRRPFSLTGAPKARTTIAPGRSITVTVHFDPRAVGRFHDTVGLDSTGGNVSSRLTGLAPARVPAAPRFLPAIVTTLRLSSLYIGYSAAVAATGRFTLQRETGGRLQTVVHGRRVTRSCLAATGRVPRAQRCTRYLTVVAFRHRDRVGGNRIHVTSAVSVNKLLPGTYRLTSVLVDTDHVKHTFRATLHVNPPRPTSKHDRRR